MVNRISDEPPQQQTEKSPPKTLKEVTSPRSKNGLVEEENFKVVEKEVKQEKNDNSEGESMDRNSEGKKGVNRINSEGKKGMNKTLKGENNVKRNRTIVKKTKALENQKVYTMDKELEYLRSQTPNATHLYSRRRNVKDSIALIIKQLSARMRKAYAKEQLDIDFTPGSPIPIGKIRKIIIASTWRSGSSFTGQLVSSYPGSFYSYEPLHFYIQNQHLESGESVPQIINFIKDIASCNFGPHQDFIDYVKNHTFLYVYNKIVWNSCAHDKNICFNAEFLSEICRYLPLNVIKIVRLGLLPIENLLEDKDLDFKVIYLLRDPRGSLHSRMQLTWCVSKACIDPKTVCEDLLSDYRTAIKFSKKYPDKLVTNLVFFLYSL